MTFLHPALLWANRMPKSWSFSLTLTTQKREHRTADTSGLGSRGFPKEISQDFFRPRLSPRNRGFFFGNASFPAKKSSQTGNGPDRPESGELRTRKRWSRFRRIDDSFAARKPSGLTYLCMVRGPAPTPKHILTLRGSKDAKYREELGTPAATLPEPPDWLRPAAKEMFRLVCGFTQQMGTLCESDTQVIARYAIVWDKWQEAEQNLAKSGECWREVLAPDGSLRFCRPTKWQAQSNHCHEQLRQLETVLGLTPADRTRLGYGAVKVVTDPVDELFGEAAG